MSDNDNNENNNNDEFGFEKDETAKSIVDQDDSKSSFIVTLGVFIGMSLTVLFYSVYTTWEFSVDDSVPLVVCPRDYTLDAPVIMKKLDANYAFTHEKWIRGFSRRFYTKLYPRTANDVLPFYTYIFNHSKDSVKSDYEARIEDIEEIASQIDSGKFISAYAEAGGTNMRIRAVNESDGGYKSWIIEIDSYFVINDGLRRKRDTPIVRFRVEAGPPTLTNPEGLYVSELEINYLKDYVSKNKLEELEDEDE